MVMGSLILFAAGAVRLRHASHGLGWWHRRGGSPSPLSRTSPRPRASAGRRRRGAAGCRRRRRRRRGRRRRRSPLRRPATRWPATPGCARAQHRIFQPARRAARRSFLDRTGGVPARRVRGRPRRRPGCRRRPGAFPADGVQATGGVRTGSTPATWITTG
jgi:hypothetical protein